MESDDDHGDLQISLLLQLGQHPRAEEDLAESDPVQVGVQVQMLDLHRQEISEKKKALTVYKNLRMNVHFNGHFVNFSVYHEAAGLFAIHEAFGDGTSSQDLITMRQGRDMLGKVYKYYNL